ncbi:MAG: DUF3106 domain-containing protein [Rubrivivax sp.]|jgi:hypothetical protein|nr:DUF3106 domain-containing protein [Rubrivivax sp.]
MALFSTCHAQRSATNAGVPRARGWTLGFLVTLAALVMPLLTSPAGARVAMPAQAPVAGTIKAVSESRPEWAALTVAQQQALGPLKPEWGSMDASRKQKWLELAARMPRMSPTERDRIQQRMAEWVRMSPTERGRARIHFQAAQQLAPGDRKDRWEAYQALPADQRQALAAQAAAKRAPAPSQRASDSEGATPVAPKAAPRTADAGNSGANTKRNVVQLPSTVAAGSVPRQVAPTVVQAKTGATTSLVNTPARPPAHHQVGLPKVNAGSEFVNPSTLLPRRGPQGAAVVAMPAASAAPGTP